jgi:hypothetical protein
MMGRRFGREYGLFEAAPSRIELVARREARPVGHAAECASILRASRRTLLGSIAAATAAFLLTAAANAQEASDYLGPHFPYALFDALPAEAIESDGGTIEIAFAPRLPSKRRATIVGWVAQSAKAITVYFGRFPVPRLRMLIVTVPGNAIHGTTWGYFGAATRITLGEDARDSEIAQSWVMAHELIHSAFPSLRRDHLWLEEGLSTYVGPIARAQAGLASSDYVWRWFMWGMPHGLPEPGDRGLDRTHSWGRTFWGGALFCLLTDLAIRSRAENGLSLQTALRAILNAGGNGEAHWPIARVLEVADRATGVPVMSELYQEMKDQPVDTDLAGLWNRLGISLADGKISFDDSAPLGAMRRAITAPPRLPVIDR